MAHQTVFYHSTMAGMPGGDLRGNAGALTTMLDAVLVNGMNTTTVTGVTRSGSTATYTLSGPNNFNIHDVVEIEGFDQAAYNGRLKVTGKTASTVTATISGTPVSPGTGSAMTMRHPAAGWTRLALGTNRVAYRTAGAKDLWLQVEDDNPYNNSANHSRVRSAQGLTALDSATVLGGQHNISKEDDTWAIVADPRTFYLVMRGMNVLMAGEFDSFVPADAFPFFTTRGETGESQSTQSRVGVNGRFFPQWIHNPNMSPSYSSPGIEILRDSSQTGGVVFGHVFDLFDSSWITGNANCKRWQPIGFPSPADGSIPMLPMHVAEYGASWWAIRGTFRGMHWPTGLHPAPAFVNNTLRLDDAVVGGTVRSAVVLRFGHNSESQIAFDLGDWA
jgi:hypothetical protein